MTNEEQLQSPRQLIARAASLATKARQCLERTDLFAIEKRNDQIRSKSPPPLLVAVVGPYSSGKSSFINAIIGRGRKTKKNGRTIYTGLLPVSVQAKTALQTRIIRIDSDSTEHVRARLKNNMTETLTIHKAEELVSLSGALNDEVVGKAVSERRKEIVHVEYFLKLPEIFDRVILIDSPGIDSMHDDHDEIAREAVRNADAVLFLTEDHLTEAEKRFVMDVKDWVTNIIFVQTRCDAEDDQSEIMELLASNSRTMAEWLEIPEKPFIATSSFDEINAQEFNGEFKGPQTLGFKNILAALAEIFEGRFSLRLDVAAREAIIALDDIRSYLESRRAVLQSYVIDSVSEAEEQNALSIVRASRNKLISEVEARTDQMRKDIESLLSSSSGAWDIRLFNAASGSRSGSKAGERCASTIQQMSRNTMFERELRPEVVKAGREADKYVVDSIKKHLNITFPLAALIPDLPQLRAPIIKVSVVRSFLSLFGVPIPESTIREAARSATESIFEEVRRMMASRSKTLLDTATKAAEQAEAALVESNRGLRLVALKKADRRKSLEAQISNLLLEINAEYSKLLRQLERA